MTAPARLEKYLIDLRTFPGDAAAAWRRERWRGLWDTLASRTVHRVYRSARLLVYAQSLGGARDVPPPAGVRFTSLFEDGCDALVGMVGRPELARFRTRLRHGHRCIVAWRGERPIGYAWVAFRMGPEVSACRLPLPDGAAYFWDLYVVPWERNHGVGSALAADRLRTAREHGLREGWRTIEHANHASIRTVERTGGGRVVGELRYVKVLARVRSRFIPPGGGSAIPA